MVKRLPAIVMLAISEQLARLKQQLVVALLLEMQTMRSSKELTDFLQEKDSVS